MLKTFRLALKLLLRDVRAYNWVIILCALVITVSTLSTLNFYTDRLWRGLIKQSAAILGGDLVVTSSLPIPKDWIKHAKNFEIRTAEVWSYSSVININQQLQLVTIEAVSNTYPLMQSAPPIALNTAWLAPRLFTQYALKVDDKIKIGYASFTIGKLIELNTDVMSTGWLIAPKIMINLADVPKTKTVLPGSRVEYKLLLAGEPKKLKEFSAWLLPKLSAHQRLLDVNNQNLFLFSVMERTKDYIQMALLVCIMLSGVAIAMSIHLYIRKQQSQIALWRCLGAQKNQIVLINIFQIISIAVIAGLVGSAIGYLLQNLLALLFKDMLNVSLADANIWPVFMGCFMSILLLFLFSIPLIAELPFVSPMQLWRKDIYFRPKMSNVYALTILLCMALFLYWFMNFSLLTLWFIDVILLCIALLYMLGLFFIKLIGHLKDHTNGAVYRGLSQLVAHADTTIIQLVSFTLVLLAIFLMYFIRHDIINKWEKNLPKHTPNYFAFNIAPNELISFQQFFKNEKVPIEGIYPMVRGRLIGLNDKPILEAIPESSKNINALQRELNLSWMWQFPDDNKITSGTMWKKENRGQPLLSLETELAKKLNVKIGDELIFLINGELVKSKILNFHSVDWMSFHPNFFVIFVPGFIDSFPSTYITSFYLTEQQNDLNNQLIKKFPNITIIDVANLVQQLLNIINKLALGLQYVFLFTSIAALLVWITTIQAGYMVRKQTYDLIKVLGGKQTFIYKSILIEFITLAGTVLAVAFFLGWLISWGILKWIA